MKRLILLALFLVTWKTYEVKEYYPAGKLKILEDNAIQGPDTTFVCELIQKQETFETYFRAYSRMLALKKNDRNREIEIWEKQ